MSMVTWASNILSINNLNKMKKKNLLISGIFILAPFVITIIFTALKINLEYLLGPLVVMYVTFALFFLFQIVGIIFSVKSLKLKETKSGGIILIIISVILIIFVLWVIQLSQIRM